MTAIANVTPITSRFDSAPAEAAASPAQTRLRLTRRGRVVFGGLATILAATVLAVIAAFAAPVAVASGDEGSGAEFPYVYVESGDTLWSIAAELDPKADTRDVVAEIVRLNQLSGAGLQAGESIAVPLRFAGNELTFPASELGVD